MESPAVASPPRAAPASGRRKLSEQLAELFGMAILAAWGGAATLLVIVPIVMARAYYATPFELREGLEQHALLRPGGYFGLWFGVLGTGMMLLMLSYTLRKSLARARWFPGSFSWWLQFHILCGVFGPMLIVLHTGLTRPRGLVAVAFWCMVLVATSGVFGRYVFGHLPRTTAGRQLDLERAREALADLRAALVRDTAHTHAPAIGLAVALARDFDMEARSLYGLLRIDLAVRRRSIRIRRLLRNAGLENQVRRNAARALIDQLKMKRSLEAWETSRRLFRLWHLFHAPLAQAMYLIVTVHIVTAVLFGGALKVLAEGLK